MRNSLPIDTEVTEQAFRQGINGWKESTSTSPSRRHLGHYKAALQDSQPTGGYQMMLNIPVQHGFAPTRC